MKCPYPECRRDYNDESWPKAMENWISPSANLSDHQRKFLNRLYVVSRQCKFCQQLFHEVYVGHENFKDFTPVKPSLELLVTYPVSKTKFTATTIPKSVIDAFNEAERCRSVGSLTGAGGCLRKSVYALCEALTVPGENFKEKISNLPVKEIYTDLLKQIKWLGDNVTKPGEEKYSLEMLDIALDILPLLIDDIYLKDEKATTAAKLLSKAKSVNRIKEEE